MGLDGGLSVRAENVNWLDDLLVDILDELFNGLLEDLSLRRCECAVVGREVFDALCPFGLLELAGMRRGQLIVDFLRLSLGRGSSNSF